MRRRVSEQCRRRRRDVQKRSAFASPAAKGYTARARYESDAHQSPTARAAPDAATNNGSAKMLLPTGALRRLPPQTPTQPTATEPPTNHCSDVSTSRAHEANTGGITDSRSPAAPTMLGRATTLE